MPALLLATALVAVACRSGTETPAPRTPSPTASEGTTGTTGTGSEPDPASPSPSRDRFDPADVRLDLQPAVEGLEAPVLVTVAGDAGRLFVVEQPGRIRVVRDGDLLPLPFLDIVDAVAYGGEQGLLGLAFHPAFASNGRFFVNYTDAAGDTVVSEFTVEDGDPDRADPTSERVLLRIDQPFANHNGGALAFGPDGYLYVATGDGGSAGDPMDHGQRLDTLLGKLLRIDVDGARPYGIPRDNPFVGVDGTRPEIWAFGLRNPWRFSFDPETGDVWIGDVGQGASEEIDHAPGNEGGLNFGWRVMEGRTCFVPATDCDRSGLTLPVAVYDHSLGCSVTGGFVYRGERWQELRGAYLFADYCSGTIWGLDAAARDPSISVLLESGRTISSFGQDEAGELYVTDHVGGEVLEIVAPEA
jgi:glucose/arabinose dehydrogenase